MRNPFLAVLLLALTSCATANLASSAQEQWTSVPLSDHDTSQTEIGHLRFLGGLHLQSSDPRFGGISGLRWAEERLFVVQDNGYWASFEPIERDDNLVGIDSLEIGELHGLDGEPLAGKQLGDAEALAITEDGNWLVSFERDHRIWRYNDLGGNAVPSAMIPTDIFGSLQANNGIEAMAGNQPAMFLCAERIAQDEANCFWLNDAENRPVSVQPPPPLDLLGGVPTDADHASNGSTYILFRSFSPADGSGAAIVEMATDGAFRTIAILRPPLTLDNMEGMAIRETENGLFLYLISDNNFSPQQRTLLLKFELTFEN